MSFTHQCLLPFYSAMLPDCDLRSGLLAHINTFLRQWKHSDNPTPATLSEAIVIALFILDKPSSELDVINWIKSSLKVGRKWPTQTYLNRKIVQPSVKHCNLTSHIEAALDYGFDLPIYQVSRFPRNGLSETWKGWVVNVGDVNSFLRRRLFDQRSSDGHFPIMRLPPEVRETIFQYALLLPTSGCRTRRNKHWTLRTTNPHSTIGYQERIARSSFARLLQVSKTIYDEAMPCFWSQSVFHVDHAEQINKCFRHFPGWRYIEHLSVRWPIDGLQPCTDPSQAEQSCVVTIAKLPRLHSLIIDTSLSEWDRLSGARLSFQCVAQFRAIKGLEELEVRGPPAE